MDTQQYVVQVWKTENRIASNGPDYNMPIVAYTEVDALKKVLEANEVSEKFYAEVRLKGNDVDCWSFTDLSLELNL